MNAKIKILVCCLLVQSCTNKPEQDIHSVLYINSLDIVEQRKDITFLHASKKLDTKLRWRLQHYNSHRDSVLCELAYKKSESMIDSMLKHNLSETAFTTYWTDSSRKVNTTIEFVNFSKQGPTAIMKRHTYTEIYIDLIDPYNKKKLFKTDYWWDNFPNDSIFDINGDGYNDLDISWYPSCGCCPRDIHDVYLFNPKTDTLETKFTLDNPSFFPRKKKVLGMLYGHPYETSMYNFKWNGLDLDTLEFIYYNPMDTTYSTFIRSNKSDCCDTTNKWEEIINDPPPIYKTLEIYYWFYGAL